MGHEPYRAYACPLCGAVMERQPGDYWWHCSQKGCEGTKSRERDTTFLWRLSRLRVLKDAGSQ
jgi:hypothetical protein